MSVDRQAIAELKDAVYIRKCYTVDFPKIADEVFPGILRWAIGRLQRTEPITHQVIGRGIELAESYICETRMGATESTELRRRVGALYRCHQPQAGGPVVEGAHHPGVEGNESGWGRARDRWAHYPLWSSEWGADGSGKSARPEIPFAGVRTWGGGHKDPWGFLKALYSAGI